MKKYMIEFTEISYGVVEVLAENEEQAREIAECKGVRYVNDSKIELGTLLIENDNC